MPDTVPQFDLEYNFGEKKFKLKFASEKHAKAYEAKTKGYCKRDPDSARTVWLPLSSRTRFIRPYESSEGFAIGFESAESADSWSKKIAIAREPRYNDETVVVLRRDWTRSHFERRLGLETPRNASPNGSGKTRVRRHHIRGDVEKPAVSEDVKYVVRD